MNYFQLFGIPVQLKVDKSALKQKYFELSRQFHPDYFIGGNDSEQQAALEQSAQVNKALKTLSNEDETIRYVLKEKGLLQDDEKYELPPLFLMDMLELNEALSDAIGENNEGAKKAVAEQIADLQQELYQPVKEAIETYRDGGTPEEDLLRVKDYYFKKKYLDRLRQQL